MFRFFHPIHRIMCYQFYWNSTFQQPYALRWMLYFFVVVQHWFISFFDWRLSFQIIRFHIRNSSSWDKRQLKTNSFILKSFVYLEMFRLSFGNLNRHIDNETILDDFCCFLISYIDLDVYCVLFFPNEMVNSGPSSSLCARHRC